MATAQIAVPLIEVVTPGGADTLVGVQGGAVKRFSVSAMPFLQTGSGAVLRTLQDKARDNVSALDFGANTVPGTTDMTAAINAAIASHNEIYLPEGVFKITSTIYVPAEKKVHGAGAKTIIRSALARGVAAFTVGNPANNVLSYGCALTDLVISPVAGYPASIGVLMYSTVGGRFSNIQVQSDTTQNITAFKLDGGASGFFNVFDNCLANHCHVGFHMTSTGPSFPTCQTFIGCSSFGDIGYGDLTSIGFFFEVVGTNSCGNDSVIIGGNVESCGTGVSIVGFNSLTAVGLRFEANTKDIKGSIHTRSCNFVSCKNIAVIDTVPLSNPGYGKNTFYGCLGPAVDTNLLSNTEVHAAAANQVALIARGASGQTAPIAQWKDNLNSVRSQINADGTMSVGGLYGTPNTTTMKGLHATTVGAAGGASGLPATPLGYLIFDVDGTTVKVPYYNN